MTVKVFEVRDRGTFIPVIAIKILDGAPVTDQEQYLLRRAGYGFTSECVILVRAECSGVDRNATYDPYAWGQATRTYCVAHNYIIEYWDTLSTGDVIDVEFILGETATRKTSERDYPTPERKS